MHKTIVFLIEKAICGKSKIHSRNPVEFSGEKMYGKKSNKINKCWKQMEMDGWKCSHSWWVLPAHTANRIDWNEAEMRVNMCGVARQNERKKEKKNKNEMQTKHIYTKSFFSGLFRLLVWTKLNRIRCVNVQYINKHLFCPFVSAVDSLHCVAFALSQTRCSFHQHFAIVVPDEWPILKLFSTQLLYDVRVFESFEWTLGLHENRIDHVHCESGHRFAHQKRMHRELNAAKAEYF